MWFLFWVVIWVAQLKLRVLSSLKEERGLLRKD